VTFPAGARRNDEFTILPRSVPAAQATTSGGRDGCGSVRRRRRRLGLTPPPSAELTAAGAVRISLGSAIAQAAYAVAIRAATELVTSGTYDSVAGGIAYDTMNDAIKAAP
jgi:hypothetical protein